MKDSPSSDEFELPSLYKKAHEKILSAKSGEDFISDDVIPYLEDQKAFMRTFLYIFGDERKEYNDEEILGEFKTFMTEKWFPMSKLLY